MSKEYHTVLKFENTFSCTFLNSEHDSKLCDVLKKSFHRPSKNLKDMRVATLIQIKALTTSECVRKGKNSARVYPSPKYFSSLQLFSTIS